MKLEKSSIEWAFDHVNLEKDTDLFPKPKEYDIFQDNKEFIIGELSKIEIGEYNWQPSRRFIVPKSDYSYRIAMQLDPVDSIIFAAIIYEYGELIEKRRIPISDDYVFNYRFMPTAEGLLYNKKNAWKNYWKAARMKGENFKYTVCLDIADFYNQIYLHTIENQLNKCGFPNQISKALKNMLKKTNQRISRGIPVGPHASHLLAEMCLIPIDEYLRLRRIAFCRFADDMILFADSKEEVQMLIYEMFKMLDSTHLMLQQSKTKIFDSVKFMEHADRMLDDTPENDLEQNLKKMMDKYDLSPYDSIDSVDLSGEETMLFDEDNIESVLLEYLNKTPSDYQRIGWLYKRLALIGIDSALTITLKHIDNLMPVINEIGMYFLSVANSTNTNYHNIGNQLLALLDNKFVEENEFVQMTIYSLFSHTNQFNQVDQLMSKFDHVNENVKREIILALYQVKADAWVREKKVYYDNMGIWSRRAFVIASTCLAREERKFFIESIEKSKNNKAEELLLHCLKDYN